jgi:hypothetical protein
MRQTTIVCAALLALSTDMAAAHHPGAGGGGSAGPIGQFMADTLDAGQIGVGFLYEYIRLGGLSNAALIQAASQHQHAHSIGSIESKSLGVAFGVAENFTVLARLPYTTRTDIREGEHSHAGGAAINEVAYRGDAAGIGDLTIIGQYRFYNNAVSGTSMAAFFGFKAPTGRTDLRDAQGTIFEAEFQPGSGSFDAIFGAALTQRLGRAAFNTNVLYFAVGTGTQNTNLGDRFHYNAAISYRLFGPIASEAEAHAHSHAHNPSGTARTQRLAKNPLAAPPRTPVAQTALDLVLEINGEWHDYQRVGGVIDPNSGGNTVYLSPGVRVTHGQGTGFLSVGIPVVNDMNGLQSRADYRVLAGAAFSFDTRGVAR